MCPSEHDLMRKAEEQHWWYRVLHRLVLKELETRLPLGSRLLDAGCGTGGMIAILPKWQTFGVDVSNTAISHCLRRELPRITPANVNELPFADASMDAVLSLDVLYHQQVDESRALAEMRRVLKPGGILLLNLPAFECLRGAHDHAVCGTRRYTVCHVREMLTLHSLKVDMIHYWNAWLFLPLLAWRRWSRRLSSQRSDLFYLPAFIHSALTQISLLDASLCRHAQIPFGSSVFAVAYRTELS
jgi:SAM-dependent methyltransferase